MHDRAIDLMGQQINSIVIISNDGEAVPINYPSDEIVEALRNALIEDSVQGRDPRLLDDN